MVMVNLCVNWRCSGNANCTMSFMKLKFLAILLITTNIEQWLNQVQQVMHYEIPHEMIKTFKYMPQGACYLIVFNKCMLHFDMSTRHEIFLSFSAKSPCPQYHYARFPLHYAAIPIEKWKLEIQARYLPRLPFSCSSIISDRNIWRSPAAQIHF